MQICQLCAGESEVEGGNGSVQLIQMTVMCVYVCVCVYWPQWCQTVSSAVQYLKYIWKLQCVAKRTFISCPAMWLPLRTVACPAVQLCLELLGPPSFMMIGHVYFKAHKFVVAPCKSCLSRCLSRCLCRRCRCPPTWQFSPILQLFNFCSDLATALPLSLLLSLSLSLSF